MNKVNKRKIIKRKPKELTIQTKLIAKRIWGNRYLSNEPQKEKTQKYINKVFSPTKALSPLAVHQNKQLPTIERKDHAHLLIQNGKKKGIRINYKINWIDNLSKCRLQKWSNLISHYLDFILLHNNDFK